MVTPEYSLLILFAEVTETATPFFYRLTPFDQIRALVGLMAVLVLGLVIYMVIKAGSHMVRGFSAAARRLPADSLPREDDWATKPLNVEPSDDKTAEEKQDH